ncbi:T9SS type A sorting domain-containing protein, partial [candidate division KSB1 bacterium]|nr:T9SS type A sorting domain-containing protein [candidate division KSB1 bacterium]
KNAGFSVTKNPNEISVYDRSVLSNSTGVVSDNQNMSSKLILNPAYPNPFNAGTTISYDLNSASFVDLSIYNLKGQLVDKICNEKQYPGRHSFRWNPHSISTGTYLIKLSADNFTAVRRCVYLQ